ncbi:hypothetical protein ACIBL6_03345 [Streptomyces sp. NPDC050400]|uniref:hypothetical protein n=1 Tax=Streptomyces sp. NPDC050400 TaxID=3365610 RepID=UPI00378E2B94
MTTRTRATAQSTRPKKNGADRRSAGRVRSTGVALILVSLVAAVLSALAFAVWLPHDRERYQAYGAAPSCQAHAPRLDCLSVWHLTVVDVVDKSSGKSSRYEATLKDGEAWRGEVDFGDPGPLLERLRKDDRVTATAWRGEIMALDKDGVRQNTSEAPRDELQMNAALGTGAALLAVQTLVFGAVRLARPRELAPFTWDRYGARLFFTILAVTFGVGLPAVWLGIPWWIVPVVAVPVALGAAVHWYRRPSVPGVELRL